MNVYEGIIGTSVLRDTTKIHTFIKFDGILLIDGLKLQLYFRI